MAAARHSAATSRPRRRPQLGIPTGAKANGSTPDITAQTHSHSGTSACRRQGCARCLHTVSSDSLSYGYHINRPAKSRLAATRGNHLGSLQHGEFIETPARSASRSAVNSNKARLIPENRHQKTSAKKLNKDQTGQHIAVELGNLIPYRSQRGSNFRTTLKKFLARENCYLAYRRTQDTSSKIQTKGVHDDRTDAMTSPKPILTRIAAI